MIKYKSKAIKLRKNGRTYSEILDVIPVAKSTLSLWLREVGLSSAQKQRITKKRIEASKKGAKRRREQRLEKVFEIKKEAKKEVGKISREQLWLIGSVLYWAEGTKEKMDKGKGGPRVEFCNTDPYMVRVYIKWLKEILEIKIDDIKINIYIHKNYRNQELKVRKYWAKVTGLDVGKLKSVYYKKHYIKSNRNKENNYYGLVRIWVRRSSDLNRKIAGWIEGICERCGVV